MNTETLRAMLEVVSRLGRESSDCTSTTLHNPLTNLQLQLIEVLLEEEIENSEEGNIVILDYLGIKASILNLSLSYEFEPVSYGLVSWVTDWIDWIDTI